MKPMNGWHFVGKTLRDGTPIPRDGVWLKHKGPLKLCKSGLHWSRDPFDALRYAPGPILCQIEARGETLHEGDKSVSRERRIVRRMDATELLRYFARHCALSVIHLYPNGTDDAVFDYLMTGDENLRAAVWAARDAAGAAAWDAARDAARAASWAASWAARDAARAGARAATWDAQREYFNLLVNECFR